MSSTRRSPRSRPCGRRDSASHVSRCTGTRRRPARVALILRAAELQHALGWLPSFAPLPRSWSAASPTTGYEDVRQIALARLLADNIPSIQVDWSLYGPKLAQVALTVGADDLDAVSALDDESGRPAAGAARGGPAEHPGRRAGPGGT